MRRIAAGVALALLAAAPAQGEEQGLPVPLTTLYPGVRIEAHHLTHRPATGGPADPRFVAIESGQLVGRSARRTLVPGQPVPLAAIGDAYAVRAGGVVRIVFRRGAFTMQATGQALGPAVAGAPVKVRNVDTGRVIDAVARPDGTVEVGE